MKHQVGYHLIASSVLLGFTLAAGAGSAAFPGIVSLPQGWGPEGIAVGRGTEFFAGARQASPLGGAVFAA